MKTYILELEIRESILADIWTKKFVTMAVKAYTYKEAEKIAKSNYKNNEWFDFGMSYVSRVILRGIDV